MRVSPNALRWNGRAGHYEVYYVTLTDRDTGIGVWIRYTMLAPMAGVDGAPTAALWFLAMDPRRERARTLGRKATLPIDRMTARQDPFELRIGDAVLTDRGIGGSFEDVAWDLHWTPSAHAYEHVHPVLQRTGIARTVLTLPHADLVIDGTMEIGGERLELCGARGGQAHLWGSKHASTWAWVHCNDFSTLDGVPSDGEFIDGVSVVVPRLGREVGPSTPVVGRIDSRDFRSISPLRVMTNPSVFGLTGWHFKATDGARKLVVTVDADRTQLAGVTYTDPDGDLAYCYNSETATMHLHVYERAHQVGGWAHRKTLVSRGRAHFEYAQRTRVPGVQLVTT